MRYKIILLMSLSLFLSACANPLNQITADRYLDQCHEAEKKGRLDMAEEACNRALVNVDWGNLGEEEKSQNLYNLARIKSRLGKFNEAEDLFKQSIEIEKKLSPGMTTKIGKRYVELSIVYFIKTTISQGELEPEGIDLSLEGIDLSQGEDRLKDGVVLLQELEPIADQYTGEERVLVYNTYQMYAAKLRKLDQNETADKFISISKKLD